MGNTVTLSLRSLENLVWGTRKKLTMERDMEDRENIRGEAKVFGTGYRLRLIRRRCIPSFGDQAYYSGQGKYNGVTSVLYANAFMNFKMASY